MSDERSWGKGHPAYDAIKDPRKVPRPRGIARFPGTCSFADDGPAGCINALETASLSFRLSISR